MEIIDPFHLYLILQLDSIKNLLGGDITVIPLIFSAITFVIASAMRHILMVDVLSDAEAAGLDKIRPILAAILITCGLAQAANAFIPSSERMAILVVLPAVVNNESVQTEAKEVYELAKRGLAKLVEDEAATSREDARR